MYIITPYVCLKCISSHNILLGWVVSIKNGEQIIMTYFLTV